MSLIDFHTDLNSLYKFTPVPTETLTKEQIVLRSYQRLYDEVVINVNEILDTFQNSTIPEVLKLYNQDTFLSLIAQTSRIKDNLLNNFPSSRGLPNFVSIFIDNYVENVYNLLYTFSFMISYIGNFNIKSKCCEVLSSLETIQQYVKDHYQQEGPTIGATAITSLPLVLKEPYNTYIERHGPPGVGGFDTSLLADIAAEFGL